MTQASNNPVVVRLRAVAAKSRVGMLGPDGMLDDGLCREAALRVAYDLEKASLPAVVVFGTFEALGVVISDRHFWVECEGYIVDVAADQFNEDLGEEVMGEVVVDLPGTLPYYRKIQTCKVVVTNTGILELEDIEQT